MGRVAVELSYGYFDAFPTPTYTFDRRLKLHAIREKSCFSGGPQLPPYTFKYYNKPAAEGQYFFAPWRLTSAVDAWGYYNGVAANDQKEFNIPQKSLTVTLADGTQLTKSSGDDNNATTDRNSYEAPMRYGALQRVVYPEGGYTELDMEANRVKQLAYDTTLVPASGMLRLNSCNLANPSSCCPDATDQRTYTFTQDFVNRGHLEIELRDVGCEDDCAGCPWQGVVSVSLTRVADNQPMGDYSFDANQDATVTVKLTDAFQNVAAGDYTVSIQSAFCYGEMRFREEQYTDISYNRVVGGLRLREKRTYAQDGSLLLKKTMDYRNPGDPDYSSGKLYLEPPFALLVASDQVNTQLSAGSVDALYVKFTFQNNPVVPLGDIQGNHIGYQYVREEQDNGAHTALRFVVRQVSEAIFLNFGYPLAPLPYFYDNGTLEQQKQATGQSVVQSSATSGFALTQYVAAAKQAARVEKITGSNGEVLLLPNTFIHDQEGSYRINYTTDTLDGRHRRTDYEYRSDLAHLQPIGITTTNSDGSTFKQVNRYAHGVVNDPIWGGQFVSTELINRHMIGIPLEQSTLVDNQLVSGTRRKYALFSGNPYPERFYVYEMTYDASGQVQVPYGPWKLRETVNAYTANGQVVQVTREGWDPMYLYWNPANHLLDSMRYGIFSQSQTYHPGTRLLASQTAADGQTIFYEYDYLQRLTQIRARSDNDITDITYNYQNPTDSANYLKTTRTLTAQPNSSFQGETTWQYFDDIGRPVQTVVQAHSPNQQDVVTATEYDAYGRPYRQYEPFESPFSNGSRVGVPAGTPFTGTTFEDSPLNRKLTVTPPGWYATTYTYGTNPASLTIAGVSYPGGSVGGHCTG